MEEKRESGFSSNLPGVYGQTGEAVRAERAANLVDALKSERPSLLALLSGRISEPLVFVRAKLHTLLVQEQDHGSGFNFVPVFFGLGIIIYFSVPAEPVLFVVLASCAVSGYFALRPGVHGSARNLAVVAALIAGGMAAAQVRTLTGGTAVITQEMTGKISGIVLGAEATRKNGVRYLIKPTAIEGIAAEKLPKRVRLSAGSRHAMILQGQSIEGIARLQAFPGPPFPGGHDFGFYNWLDGFGATGFFMGAPKPGGVVAKPGLLEKLLIWTNQVRALMTQRIRTAIGGEAGDISAALITGERLAVDEDTEEGFRRSGLTHILSISGLHMVLVTLTAVGTLRFLLAFSPALTLGYAVRKWALGAGFVSSTFYLLLSGAEVPTQRSYLMIAIMLVAMLFDRRAITLRNVALAAIIILVLTPEAVMEPGFQMSFAAAAALVSGHGAYSEHMRLRHARAGAKPIDPGILKRMAMHIAGLLMTSLIAGVATGIFAAWHFHRVAPMGLFANLLAMPLVSFAVMPLAVAGVLLMPYGLEWLALKPMGWAVNGVVRISDFVNQYPSADGVGMQSMAMLLLGTFGLLILIGLQTKLRLAGIPILASIAVLPPTGPPPDIMVSQNGRSIAVRNKAGDLAMLYPGRDQFTSDIWSRAWPPKRKKTPTADIAACDKEHCVVTARKDVRLEIVYNPDLLAEACKTADILVAPRLRWLNCREEKPALVLLRGNFEAAGMHAITIGGNSSKPVFSVTTGIEQDNRPWNLARRPPPDENDAISIGGSVLPDDLEPSPYPD